MCLSGRVFLGPTLCNLLPVSASRASHRNFGHVASIRLECPPPLHIAPACYDSCRMCVALCCRETVSPEGKDIVGKLLTVDAAKRLSAEEALRHPWVAGHVFEGDENKGEAGW